MAQTIDDILNDVAAGPAEVSSDAGTVRQHPIPDLIELAKYQASKAAVSNPFQKLQKRKISPDGAA